MRREAHVPQDVSIHNQAASIVFIEPNVEDLVVKLTGNECTCPITFPQAH